MCCQAEDLQILKSHTSDVTCLDFSLDCLLVTGSGDKTVRVWGWKPGLGYVELDFSPLKGHKYGVTSVGFSPQGTMLASSSIDGSTMLWSARTGKKIHKFIQVNGDPVRICRFNNDSCTFVTAGDNGVVCIWDLVNRTLLRTIQHHEDAIFSLAFTPDSNYLLTSCNQGTIKLYNFSDLRDTTVEDAAPLVSVDDAHDLGVLCCDFSSVIKIDDDDPQCCIYSLVTSGNDQCLRQWTVRCLSEGKQRECSGTLAQVTNNAHSSAITCARFNQRGDLICSSSLDKTVKIWNLDGKCLLNLDAHNRYVNCVSFSKNGDFLCSGSNDKTVRIWDMTGGAITVDSELVKPCSVLSHFGCGDLKGISMVQEDDIVLFKGDNSDNEVLLLQTFDNLHTAAINCLEFNKEGLLATASGDKTVRLFKQQEETELLVEAENSPFSSHSYQVNTLTFTNQDLLASGSLDGSIMFWRPYKHEKRPLLSLITHQLAGVRCVRVTGNWMLAAYDDGTAAVWSLEPLNATPLVVYPEHADATTSCACSPDGKLVSSGSHSEDFRIYALPDNGMSFNNEAIHVQDCAHDLGIQGMDFAPTPEELPLQIPEDKTCHLLATCGNDCLVKIWKIVIPKAGSPHNNSSVTEWRILAGHGSSVTSVRFPSNRSDLICTTSTDKQARIWSIYPGQCLHVLEHESLVATSSFGPRGALLATGCLSGQLCIWKLPRHLVFESDPGQLIISSNKNPMEWSGEELLDWLRDLYPADQEETNDLMRKISVKLLTRNLKGRESIPAAEEILQMIIEADPNNSPAHTMAQELRWLRLSASLSPSSGPAGAGSRAPEHHMLCPITHCLMLEPVKCADGFTYEKKAINEWFLSGGKYVSPMTNQPLLNNIVTPNRELRKEIMKYLFDEPI